jgi:hypothetical protein
MSSLSELARFSKSTGPMPMGGVYAPQQPRRRVPGAVPLAVLGGAAVTFGGSQAAMSGTRRLKARPDAAKYVRKIGFRTAAAGGLIAAAGAGVAAANRRG